VKVSPPGMHFPTARPANTLRLEFGLEGDAYGLLRRFSPKTEGIIKPNRRLVNFIAKKRARRIRGAFLCWM
jgi:hypothetical protein